MKLLSREEFKEQVFKRDKNKCVACNKPPVDAHHILERKLFPDGGYYLDNGASLCEEHHLLAETTELSVEALREAIGVKSPLLPPGFHSSLKYDKWGNQILKNKVVPGPLFNDRGCQKMLELKTKNRKF